MKVTMFHQSLFETPPPYDFDQSRFKKPEGGRVRLYEYRGCNGSGKSFLPFSLLEKCPDSKLIELGEGLKIMVCPTFKTVMLGKYLPTITAGGCDTISQSDDVFKTAVAAKRYILENYPQNASEWRILMEGIITATSTFSHVERILGSGAFSPEDISIIWLDVPFEVCLDRVRNRNGREPNVDIMKSKYRQIERQPAKIAERYPTITRMKYQQNLLTKDEIIDTYLQLDYTLI